MQVQTIKINAAAVTAITNVAIAHATDERAMHEALPVLRAQFKGVAREVVRDTIAVNYAACRGVELKVQGTGRLVWPADAGTPKKACNRLVARVLEDDSANHTAKAKNAPRVDSDLLARVQNQIAKAGLTKAEARALFAAVIEAAYE